MHTRSKRYRRRQQARLRRAAVAAGREAKVNENRLAVRVAKCLRKVKDSPIGPEQPPALDP